MPLLCVAILSNTSVFKLFHIANALSVQLLIQVVKPEAEQGADDRDQEAK